MKVILSLILFFSLPICAGQTISFAVGHDHDKMVKNYPFYAASWEIINQELAKVGYKTSVHTYPWARAKEKVKNAEHDGLFLAANFHGREKWARFTMPIGNDQFGYFVSGKANLSAPIGSVRLGDDYSLLTFLAPDAQLQFTTAQEGLPLLANNKLSAFVMSRSYGEYLLKTDLKSYADKIKFHDTRFELYTAHVAVSRTHPNASDILNILNNAIEQAIQSGTYRETMTKFNVRPVQLIK